MTELTDTADIASPAADEAAPAVVDPPAIVPRRKRFASFARTAGGVSAIGVKELRGRMRGRRAFAIITIYLLLLGGFALMAEKLVEANFSSGFGGQSAFAGAAIGQGIFAALLMLMTLQVAFLAPSSTSGSISLEREKQTLELLIATPISSLAIVVGKLLSALVYVFLLIAASIPLMAVVFVYGGVGPEDVLRGYVVLIATALGLGSFGLLCSSIVKRTTAATAITIFGVLAVTIGTVFVLGFWQAVGRFDANGNRQPFLGIQAPAVLGYLNPFIAQADVMCGTETSFGGGWCGAVNGLVPSNQGVIFTQEPGPVPMPVPAFPGGKGGVIDNGVVALGGVGLATDAGAPNQVQPFDVQREALWPKSVVTWLILSVVFLLLSVQAVSPTRRWHIRRRKRAAAKVPE
ncbi:MAG: type transport system permease protein [Chloroflexota bacterium]|jgi:ABC-type transport system involved in multi-copper enzyme maturation permease subunit|nr:type transport system permease protein [Chloroflexota bacterium]MEA2612598.1 type transport system permease protein [Chloroflexota bacterium]